jgi:hypothetical protein
MSGELGAHGAGGTRSTATALATLPPEQWTVLHDVRWPGPRYANIDNIVVGAGGVFVIDSKDGSGSVTTGELVAAVEAALAVSLIAPSVPTRHVQPVICFVRDEPIDERVRDVAVCSTSTLTELLLGTPAVLDEAQVRAVAMELEVSLRRVATPYAELDRLPRRRTEAGSSRAHRRSRMSRWGARTKLALGGTLLVIVLTVVELGYAVMRG